MRKTLISVLVTAALAVVAYVLTGAFVSDATPKPASNHILTGEYHQIEGPKGMIFTAVITDGEIQVDLKMEGGDGDSDVYGIYWVGTFNTSNTSDTFTVVSTADNKKLEKSVFGSQDDTKSFTYKNGKLSFGFSIDLTGLKTTVVLSK